MVNTFTIYWQNKNDNFLLFSTAVPDFRQQ